MNRRIVVYGASGHGKVVADILLAGGLNVACFIDDDAARQKTTPLGFPVRGSDWLRSEAKSVAIALGVGDNHARMTVADRCLQLGAELLVAIHPTAAVAKSARLAPGTVVMANVVVNPDARIGTGVILNSGCVVEHDVEIGDYAHLSPNAATGGAARIGQFTHIGLGAVILPGIAVGENCVIGAGAVVVRDIPAGVVASGVPARVSRPVSSRRSMKASGEKH